jgi:hypothetical protein
MQAPGLATTNGDRLNVHSRRSRGIPNLWRRRRLLTLKSVLGRQLLLYFCLARISLIATQVLLPSVKQFRVRSY